MATATQLKAKEAHAKLSKQLAELARAAGIAPPQGESERERDAKRKALKRAEGRNIYVPPIKDVKARLALEEDDCEWLRWYFPDVFYNPFTADHRYIIDNAGKSLRYGSSKCIAAPRRDGKSSVLKYLQLKYSLQRVVRFPLILCATGPKGDDTLKSIKARLRMNNPRFADAYPLECYVSRYVSAAPAKANAMTVNYEDKLQERFLDHERLNVEWRDDRIILPSFECDATVGPILMALGWTSDQIQGLNVYDIRPDFVMLDDLDSRESLAAEDGKIAAKIEEIIDKNISGLGGQSRRLGIFYLCTITSHRSAGAKYSNSKEKPVFSGIRIARLKKKPDRMDLWDEYIALRQKGQNTFDEHNQPIDRFGREAHRFYLANREAMDAGAVLSNEHDYDRTLSPDGTEMQISALQMCFDYIADKGWESFQTEHQNDPPADDDIQRFQLTPYHIANHCRSGLNSLIVPADAVSLVCGIDVKKAFLHYSIWAFSAEFCGCCIAYGMHELNTEGKDWKAVEPAILAGLHDWREQWGDHIYKDTDDCERTIDLTLIDRGWKHESWAGQPVDVFCGEMGFSRYVPSLGQPNYRPPKPNPQKIIPGDNWNVTYAEGYPIVHMNSDHWKQKVHEGFYMVKANEPGQRGALLLFEPPRTPDGRVQRNPHQQFAKHITSEVWEARAVPGFKNVVREGWYWNAGQNHFFDATYAALVAGSIRSGASSCGPLQAAKPQPSQAVSAAAPAGYVPDDGGGRVRW